MGVKGRKTAADKVVQLRMLEQMGLPPAPACLSDAAAMEWKEIVETYPGDRFPRSTWPMLEGYCVHAVEARKLMAQLNAVNDETSIQRYNMLLTMFDRETKAVASFGVRLGIARTSMAGRHNNDPDTVAERDVPWKT